jgi:NADH dehydrogenase FAD-containing subunit
VDTTVKDGNIYTTRSGIKIEAELHFWCIGKRLGTAWLKNSEFKSWLDNNGRLRVDSTLRLVGIPNVFCAGDLTDIPVRTSLHFVTTVSFIAKWPQVNIARSVAA